ncbi:hypothetical protein M0R04_15610 [Candidatus Dojkabacteria bacterium]|jgi:hypothetical protein|nr:hypothetical protein [Candidatus Dojkabacteria bacterium]
MVHTGIFCSKAEIDVKVGENVDLTGYTETNINASCLQAEAYINVACRYNFSDNYATLNADVKGILSEMEACWVAVDFISYNMFGYSSRIEAEDMINLQWAKFKRLLEVLIEQMTVTYIKGA